MKLTPGCEMDSYQLGRIHVQCATLGISYDKMQAILAAHKEGRLQIVDKDLFCRNAAKRNGKCAGYNENRFSHKTLLMCAACEIFDGDCDDEEYFDDTNPPLLCEMTYAADNVRKGGAE